MRHFLVVAALLVGSAGCCSPRLPDLFGRHVAEKSPPDHSEPAPPAEQGSPAPAPGEVYCLDVATLELPLGDRFLNYDLWEHGDEQGVPLETKPVLQENGLRVGQVGGLLPARLQALLSAKRTCPDPRRLRAPAEQPTAVTFGPRLAKCAFDLRGSVGGGRSFGLSDAQGVFEVTPLPQDDGTLRLRFLPRVRHGKAKVEPRVTREADGSLRWMMEAQESVEDLPNLRWELSVTPGEYVLIGAHAERPGTLGHALFLARDEAPPRQRLLVLRAMRVQEAQQGSAATRLAPPVAAQAAWALPPAERR